MSSDEALFEKLIGGDMRAFDRLYDRFSKPLYGFIRAQLGDSSEAEDVLHEAFMAVLREREKRTEMRSFRAWLFSVAHHLCLNRVRARKRPMPAAAGIEESAPLADRLLEQRQVAERLQHAVARLPHALAEVYRLRASGMSYEEVADVLALPLGTVKSRMHEMVKRLRDEVET
jgi:RNA polymerase sigma-70 factor (ECF subfamily)